MLQNDHGQRIPFPARRASILPWVAILFVLAFVSPVPAHAQGTGLWEALRGRLFGPSKGAAEAALKRQGGSRILIKIDTDALRRQTLVDLRDDVRRRLREARIGFADLGAQDASVDVRIRQAGDRDRAMTALAQASTNDWPAGSIELHDMGDGLIRLMPAEKAWNESLRAAIKRSVEVIGTRAEGAGIATPGVRQDGPDRILVLLPGIKDPDPLMPVLVRPARLAFSLVDTSTDVDALQGRAPPDFEILHGLKDRQSYLVAKQSAVSGEHVADAAPGFDLRTNEPIVTFRFNAAGTRRFAQVTQENIGRPFAIVLDRAVISAPVIREPIVGGSGQITGGFTVQEAQLLAVLLRSGTLPAPLVVVEQQVVEPAGQAGQK
jgi:preprotein translocase subunit SecD